MLRTSIAIASLVTAAAACGSGGGGPIVTNTGNGRDVPSGTRDDPNGGGTGTGSTTSGSCASCGNRYSCSDHVTIDLTQGCTEQVLEALCKDCVANGDGFTCGAISCHPESQPGGGTTH